VTGPERPDRRPLSATCRPQGWQIRIDAPHVARPHQLGVLDYTAARGGNVPRNTRAYLQDHLLVAARPVLTEPLNSKTSYR
jgi:hypothetical protein